MAATVIVDDEPFTITGRIDRVDRHADGRYRVIDYKTADTPVSPETSHRRGKQKQWIDLQLPLYHQLLRGEGITQTPELAATT